MKKRWFPLLIVPLLLLSACAEEEKETPEIPVPNVEVLDLSEKPQYQITEVGTIKALQEVELIAKAAGTVGQISVHVGDLVKAGEVIAVVDFDESNNPAKVHYDNAQLQLTNARQTRDESYANNQDTITRAQLRVESLEKTLGRLQRNLTELRATNKSTEATLALQLENARKNENTAEVNYQNMVDQFDQSWKDLLASATNTLNTAFSHLASEFIAVEDIINPSNQFHFSVSTLNSAFGVRNSIQRSQTVNAYNDYRRLLEDSQVDYSDYLPLNDYTIDEALEVGLQAAEDLRILISSIRLMISNSVPNEQTSQGVIDAYLAQVTAAESMMLSDVALLNSLEKTLQTFRLDRVRQLATADNNRVIAGNQLIDTRNALLTFQTTESGSIQDLEVQIEQTGNDLLSAQADLDSAMRGATIQNSAKDLEISTLSNQLRLAEKSLEDNKIISTIHGSLSELTVEEGDYISPGTRLGKVIRYEQVKVIFYVAQDVADRLTLGHSFTFSVSSSDVHDFLGVVSQITPAADSVNRKIQIEGLVINEGHFLTPGMLVNLSFDISAATFDPAKIYVPMKAVIFAQNDRYVYVVENGRAERRKIEVGEVYGSWIEVMQGLAKTDELIVEGQRNLPPSGGVAVNVIQ
ncbi:efflux RND transporter periplasmic adaptor subunit [Candidatus Peregrinibacteria bacterium]|nr:efflux RND transporter periplasmic adaptor subunit [Candidatus Peregrinibacteria bacterium]